MILNLSGTLRLTNCSASGNVNTSLHLIVSRLLAIARFLILLELASMLYNIRCEQSFACAVIVYTIFAPLYARFVIFRDKNELLEWKVILLQKLMPICWSVVTSKKDDSTKTFSNLLWGLCLMHTRSVQTRINHFPYSICKHSWLLTRF